MGKRFHLEQGERSLRPDSEVALTRQSQRVIRSMAGFALPALLLLLWLRNDSQLYWLPAPHLVWNSWWELLVGGGWWQNSLASLLRLSWGLSIGVILGTLVGVLLATSRLFRILVEPMLRALAPVPPIAWIPFLIVLLGIDEASKIALIALGSFFIVQFHVASALKQVDENLMELAHALQKSRSEVLLNILWPGSLVSWFFAVRLSWALGWTLLLTAEIVASSRGLGWLLWDSRNFGRMDDTIATIVVIGALGYAGDLLIQRSSHFFLRWRPSKN